MRGLSLLLAVAACSSPAGLTLEVMIDDPDIERVELFVGEHCSGDCPHRIVPPDLPMMLVTNTYVVTDSVPWSVDDFDGGVAGFRLESPHDTTVAILVAVGYDAQDQIRWSSTFHDVHVPSDEAVYWRVKLSPTTPIAPPPVPPQPAGTERIKHWHQPSRRLPSCLLLEHWTGNTQPTRDLVVPEEDHDCDEIPEAAECAPWIPNAVGVPPTLDTASCLLIGRLDDPVSNVCMIGGPECTENNSTPADQCISLAEPYCVSTNLCECIGTDDFASCVSEIVESGLEKGTMPSISCTFQLDEEGRPCNHDPVVLDLAPFLLGSPTKCAAIGLNEWSPPLGSFTWKLHIGNTAKLEIVDFDFDAQCKGELKLDGELDPRELLAAFELELDNGNHIVVPLKLSLAAGCGTASRCSAFVPDTDDAIWSCVAPPQMTCAPEPSSTCAGPMCNGVCCNEGERCTPDGCSCGGADPCTEPGDVCQSLITPASRCGTVCCGGATPCPF